MSPIIEHAADINSAAQLPLEAVVVPFQEDKLAWQSLHKSGDPGYARGVLSGPRGTNHETYTIKVPPGHGAPQHAVTGELTVCVLQGRVCFTTTSRDQVEQRHVLSRHDLLFIPEATRFRYSNLGRRDAMVLMIAGKGPGGSWPLSGAYDEERATTEQR